MSKRETIGQRLKREREEQELSVPQLAKKIDVDFHFPIGPSTIRDLEGDKTPNPGIKTLESVALGLGLDPLEIIGLGLDDPPQLEPGYTESQFAQLGRTYKKVPKNKRAFADEFTKMLIEQMERWR
jgi:transcriptional regulator with XRE-family HTH domain